MSNQGPRQRFHENFTGIVSILVTAIWMGALFTGQDWWLAALLVGYILVVPLVALLFGDESDREEWWNRRDEDQTSDRDAAEDAKGHYGRTADRAAEDALETLRRRYAAGQLTDEQFERKLERLLETETLEDVEERVRPTERTAEHDDRS